MKWLSTRIGAALLLVMAGLTAQSEMPTPGEALLFSDDLTGELAEGWEWLREQPGDRRPTPEGLEIRIRPGDAHSVTTALVRPAPWVVDGPVVFEVTVTFLQPPTEQFEQAGLTWYDGDFPVFKFVHELVDGEMMTIPGRVPTAGLTVTLRLRIGGGRFVAEVREEGEETFTTVEEGDLNPGADGRISLQAYHGPATGEHWVRFRDFRVLGAAE